MMNEKLRKMFEDCRKFIRESSPEELIQYEKSLGLNYDDYSDDIDYSPFVDLACNINEGRCGLYNSVNNTQEEQLPEQVLKKLAFAA